MKVLGFDFGHYPHDRQLVMFAGFFMVCSIGHGYWQETIFHLPGFKFGWFVTAFDMLLYVILAVFERFECRSAIQSLTQPRRTPMALYVLLSLTMVASNGLGTAALAFLNYPTKVIIRSCKIIPVMFVGVVVVNRTYSIREYFSALVLILGTIQFTLGDAEVLPTFSSVGLILAIVSVFADAFFSNIQEKILQQYNAPQRELIFISNALGFMNIFVILLVTGEMFVTVQYVIDNPSTLLYLLALSMFGYLSLVWYSAMIKHSGVVVALTVASVRKVITILLSFLLFPKPFTMRYVVAGVLVSAGLFLSVQVKQQKVTTTAGYKPTVEV